MKKISQIEFLDTKIHNLSMLETIELIEGRIQRNTFTQHVVVNVAKLVKMRRDCELKESVEACDIINIDGMGIVWGARMLGNHVPERVSGIDLFFELLKKSQEKSHPVFFLGATEEIVMKTVSAIEQSFPRLIIAGYHHGYFWDDEESVVRRISTSGAKLLFVAITSPKKESFINKWKHDLNVKFVMGVGGTFDIIAGKTKRAPRWVQNAGLEWLYRIYQEPGRMWRRYLNTNTIYLYLLLKELISTLHKRKHKKQKSN